MKKFLAENQDIKENIADLILVKTGLKEIKEELNKVEEEEAKK